jgi:large repetitive protein
VNGAASTPYNVAVGGTQFADTGKESTYWSAANATDLSSALGYIPEAAWNSSCDPGQAATTTNCAFGNTNLSLLASGGGASSVYTPKPSWQTGTGVPADNARDIPDVALAASSGHDQYVYCFSLFGTPCQVSGSNGVTGLTIVGGTSTSTPAMAGILALVEQKNGAYQGQINYVLYKLAQSNSCNSSTQTNPTAQNSCIFYDVTTGNNSVPCAGASQGCSSQTPGTNGLLNGATAGAGYDMVTGLGSVNAANLANNWKNITFLGSQTTLNAAVASAVHGTPLTLTGTVAASTGTGTPTGSVAFQTNTTYGNPPDVLALASGSFAGAISDLPGGQYSLTAHYTGDGTYGASDSAPVAFTITPEASTTQLTVNAVPPTGPIAYGTFFQLVVNVAGVSKAGIATGTVTLQDGASTVGVYPLAADGNVTIPTGLGTGFAFAPGAHSLTAVYSGDNSFNGSSSNQATFSITKSNPFVSVGGNALNLPAGSTLGVHADIHGSGTALPTGTVQFTDNGVAIGPILPVQVGGLFDELGKREAQVAALLPNLSQGVHTIGAAYDGSADPNYNSVASGDPQNEGTFSVTVGAASGNPTTTTLSATKLPVNLGDTGTFVAKVTPTTATGTITLWDVVGPRTTATPISGGTVSISFPWPQGGSTALYAVYSGDGTNASSSSGTVPFTVKQGVPVVAISAPANSEPSQQISVNVSVTGNPANVVLVSPTGAIEIWDSLNGAPAQLLTVQTLTAGAGNISVYATRLKLSVGTHALHTHYRGDLNWQAADSATATVMVSDFSLLIAPDPLAFSAGTVGTATATITPTSNFSGAITFTCPAGNTSLPTGYTCSMTTVTVSGSAATTQLMLHPPASTNVVALAEPSGDLKPPLQSYARFSLTAFTGSALLLLVALAFAAKPALLRQVAVVGAGGLFIGSLILGCGGGGGGGGGLGGGTNPVVSTTVITTSNTRAASGQALQITANVTASVTPSGTVQFFDNGAALGAPQTLAGGTATLQTSALSVGVHSLKAVYTSSSSTVLGSSSNTTTEMVLGTVTFQVNASSANGVTHSTMMRVTLN